MQLELYYQLKRLFTFAIAAVLALLLSAHYHPVQAQAFSEYDLLLLDVKLDRQSLAESVTAYQYNGSIVVSLAEAGAALEFPISVDAENGTANGWFISEERRFELSLDTATVVTDGNSINLSPFDAIVFDHGIYVTLDAFSSWFPVTLTAQLSTMSIDVEAHEALPTQLRAQRRQLSGQRFVMSEPSLPELALPYQLIGSHTADIALGYSVRRETNPDGKMSSPETSLTHSTLIRGDLAYMTSAIYLGGSDEEPLGYARMTLSRSTPDTPTGIDIIELGDITPIAISGAPQSEIERGLRIKGSTAKNSDAYSSYDNKTHITGDVQEGWEVELLHNNIRVDYQIIGPEGQYDFRDLILYTGTNTFELIFYGPAGEQYSETITRYSGVNAINKGELSYEFTASQKATSLFKSNFTEDKTISNKGSEHYTASVGLGVLSNLSINSAWNSALIDNDRLNYYSLGFRAGFGKLYLSVDATRDPLGGTIWNGVINLPVSMRLLGFNTQFEHTQYANSALATDETYELQINTRSSLVLIGNIKSIDTRLSATYNKLTGKSSTSYSADLSKKSGVSRIGNTLIYQVFDDPSQQTLINKRLSGILYFSTKFDPLTIRGNVNYQLEPAKEIHQYKLNANLPIISKMNMYFSLDHSPTIDRSNYSAGLNWQLKHITISPRISYDSDERYTGFIFASLSLSPKPDRPGILVRGQSLANTGGVAARAFLDHDNDGQFSDDDQALPSIDIYGTQVFKKATTDDSGTAYLSGLRPNKATDIQIDQESLPEIFLHSKHPGNSVRPRAARWTVIDFPIIATGELDGYLYQQNKLKRTPRPGMIVELRDQSNALIDFKISGHDGFFLFEHIPYGQYTLTLTEENRVRLTHAAPTVKIDRSQASQQGLELTIAPLTAPAPNAFALPRDDTPASIIPSTKAETKAPIASKLVTEAINDNLYAIQLAAFRSYETANEATMILRNKFTEELRGLKLKTKASAPGPRGVFFRVFAVGDMNESDANARCQALKQAQQSCIVVKESFTQ